MYLYHTFSYFNKSIKCRLSDCRNNNTDEVQVAGQKSQNLWGFHDMHGNVIELVGDERFASSYPRGKVVDYYQPAGGSCRVFRGGSFRSSAEECRSANRAGSLARDPDQQCGVEDCFEKSKRQMS